nr:gtpase-activating protein gyp7 [Quercus suber]
MQRGRFRALWIPVFSGRHDTASFFCRSPRSLSVFCGEPAGHKWCRAIAALLHTGGRGPLTTVAMSDNRSLHPLLASSQPFSPLPVPLHLTAESRYLVQHFHRELTIFSSLSYERIPEWCVRYIRSKQAMALHSPDRMFTLEQITKTKEKLHTMFHTQLRRWLNAGVENALQRCVYFMSNQFAAIILKSQKRYGAHQWLQWAQTNIARELHEGSAKRAAIEYAALFGGVSPSYVPPSFESSAISAQAQQLSKIAANKSRAQIVPSGIVNFQHDMRSQSSVLGATIPGRPSNLRQQSQPSKDILEDAKLGANEPDIRLSTESCVFSAQPTFGGQVDIKQTPESLRSNVEFKPNVYGTWPSVSPRGSGNASMGSDQGYVPLALQSFSASASNHNRDPTARATSSTGVPNVGSKTSSHAGHMTYRGIAQPITHHVCSAFPDQNITGQAPITPETPGPVTTPRLPAHSNQHGRSAYTQVSEPKPHDPTTQQYIDKGKRRRSTSAPTGPDNTNRAHSESIPPYKKPRACFSHSDNHPEFATAPSSTTNDAVPTLTGIGGGQDDHLSQQSGGDFEAFDFAWLDVSVNNIDMLVSGISPSLPLNQSFAASAVDFGNVSIPGGCRSGVAGLTSTVARLDDLFNSKSLTLAPLDTIRVQEGRLDGNEKSIEPDEPTSSGATHTQNQTSYQVSLQQGAGQSSDQATKEKAIETHMTGPQQPKQEPASFGLPADAVTEPTSDAELDLCLNFDEEVDLGFTPPYRPRLVIARASITSHTYNYRPTQWIYRAILGKRSLAISLIEANAPMMAPSTPPSTATVHTTDQSSPPSPSASFYDMSDEEEDEYSTIRHSKMSKGVKLLYTKSKVYMHPTPSAKENVPGYMSLLQQKSSHAPVSSRATGSSSDRPHDNSGLLLAWQPESSIRDVADIYTKVEMSDSTSPPRQSHLVPLPPVTASHSTNVGTSAFSIPVSEIFSILVRPPSTGWWFGSVVINTREGEGFPALFFHDPECQSTIDQRKRLQRETFEISANGAGVFWGGDEVLRWLKNYCTVERSAHEASVYLIDPSEADKLAFGSSGNSKPTPDKVRNVLEGKHKDDPNQRQNEPADPVMKVLKQARWTFLEKMSQVTTFTRRTAQAVAENKNIPPQVRRLMLDPQVQTVSDEFDSARLYLARWAMGIAEQSERDKNQRIWTARDVLEMEESEVGQFEILDIDAQGLSLADRRTPVTLKEWDNFFNSRTGRMEKTPDEVKERIFHGGLEDNVRKEAWLFLLGVYEWDSTREERLARMNSLRDEFLRLKGQWWERMVDEQGTLAEREWWKEQKMRIGEFDLSSVIIAAADMCTDRAVSAVEKDVHRTDRHIALFAGEDIPHPDPDSPFAEAGTNVHLEQMKDMLLTYNEYNRDLGYVQGMSDLLAPIYAIEQDDAVAFWGFVGFMDRMERNFLRDQSGMRLQLLTLDHLVQLLDPKLYQHLAKLDSTNFFFFFRMLLVWFKREFEFPDILRLWETLWTDYLSSNFHLFIAVAILEKHRDVIMEHLKGFDEVLKYVNELSGGIDLPSTLIRAEALFRRFQRMVEAIDRKSSFPAAPTTVRQRLPRPPDMTTTKPGSTGQPRRVSNNAPGPASASYRDRTAGDQIPASSNAAEQKVVSPELRVLLSREIPKLDKTEVREHGGGLASDFKSLVLCLDPGHYKSWSMARSSDGGRSNLTLRSDKNYRQMRLET